MINETDSPFNLTLLVICQSNANFKTELVIQNELLPLTLGKSSLRMGFTWQGSDHISVGRCVIPCAFFGKSVKHIFSCSKMYPD